MHVRSLAVLDPRQGGRGVHSLLCTSVPGYGQDHRPSHPYYAGMEHVGFSPTRQTTLRWRGGERGEKLVIVLGRSIKTVEPSHPYHAGTEYVGFHRSHMRN